MTTRINQSGSMAQMLKICSLCALGGTGLSLLLLLVFSIASYSGIDDPDGYLNAFSIISASVGALSAGFAACKLYRSRGLFCGMICGAEMLVALFLFSKLLSGDPSYSGFAPAFPIIIICLLAFGSAGGLACSNLKRKRDPLKRKNLQAQTKKLLTKK